MAAERAASGQEAAAPERAVCAQRCGVRTLLAGDLPRRQRAGREAEGMSEGFPDVFMLFILSWILFSPSLLGTSSSSPLSSFYHSSSPLPSSLDPHYTLPPLLVPSPICSSCSRSLHWPLSPCPSSPSHPFSPPVSVHVCLLSLPPSASPSFIHPLGLPLVLSLPFSLT